MTEHIKYPVAHTHNLPEHEELGIQPILYSYHHGNWTGVKSLYYSG